MSSAKPHELDEELADLLTQFYADPLGFVMFAYDWDTDATLQVVELPEPWRSRYDCKYGPDAWACEFLEDIGAQVERNGFDGVHAVDPIKMAIVSGHGIGKSAMVGWLVDWIMSTRPHAEGTITATTNQQLRTKTWAQIATWTKKCITSHWFHITSSVGSMRMQHKRYPDTWFCQAQSCAEENSEAFAGQHKVHSTSFYIFDEASGVPDKIDEVSEGGLTDGEPMKFAFGNGTQNDGWFYDCFGKNSHRWGTRHIDSRAVQITNKKKLQQDIDDHGIDSDFVKTRIRGMFPDVGAKQFISTSDIDQAFGRHLRPEQYCFAPKVLTLDPAWTGEDELVFGLRQGLYFNILATWDKNDNDVEVANALARFEDDYQADGVIIDMGYGTGVYSVGKTLGRDWLLADFASKSPDPGCINLRAYMWNESKKWLKQGGALPEDHKLREEGIKARAIARMDGKLQMESKKDAAERGAWSPNRWDSLGLSFAFPVTHKPRNTGVPNRQGGYHEHNPYDPAGRILNSSTPDHNPYDNV